MRSLSFLKFSAFVLIAVGLAVVGSVVFAVWQEPAQAPPGGDISLPGDGYSLDAADGTPTDAVYVDNDGNVGIGTTNPADKLHIEGTDAQWVWSTDGRALKLNSDGGGWDHYPWIGFYRNMVRGMYLGFGGPGNYINMKLENGVDLSISGGNVGIGTTAPDAKLQVGTQNSHWFHIPGYDKTYTQAQAACAAQGARLAYYSEMVDYFVHGGSWPCSWGWTQDGDYGVVTFVMQDGAPSGCGGAVGGVRYAVDPYTTTYGANCARDIITVKGSINVGSTVQTRGIRIEGGQDSDQAFFGLFGQGSNDDYVGLRIIQSDGGALVFNEDGNVGIGTTNPQGKLDVNGAIYQRGSQLHADYVFDDGYNLESIEDHTEFMWHNKHLKAIPQAKKDESGNEIVNIGEQRRGILEELEKAHVYIAQLNQEIKQLKQIVCQDHQDVSICLSN